MDKKVLGLSIALSYPGEAFKNMPPSVVEQSADLVRRASRGEQVAADVTEFLRSQPRINEWVAQLLEDRSLRPPHLRPDSVRSYEALAGDHGRVSAPRYVCAKDGVAWYQAFEFEAVPECRLCGKKLIPA